MRLARGVRVLCEERARGLDQWARIGRGRRGGEERAREGNGVARGALARLAPCLADGHHVPANHVTCVHERSDRATRVARGAHILHVESPWAVRRVETPFRKPRSGGSSSPRRGTDPFRGGMRGFSLALACRSSVRFTPKATCARSRPDARRRPASPRGTIPKPGVEGAKRHPDPPVRRRNADDEVREPRGGIREHPIERRAGDRNRATSACYRNVRFSGVLVIVVVWRGGLA